MGKKLLTWNRVNPERWIVDTSKYTGYDIIYVDNVFYANVVINCDVVKTKPNNTLAQAKAWCEKKERKRVKNAE